MTQKTAAVGGDAESAPRSRFKDRLRDGAHAAVRPIVLGLARVGVGPDTVSVIGLIFSLAAALAFLEGAFRWASVVLMLAGLCDLLDGELARETRGMSKFGAFLDSTLDRIAEGIVLLGIAGFYLANLVELAHSPSRVIEELTRGLEPRTWAVVALTAMVAAVGSFLVSYTRARAEGLGLECKVGWFERPERVVLLIIAGLFGVGPAMPGALLLLALLSLFTAAQRIRHVYKITRPGSPGASS